MEALEVADDERITQRQRDGKLGLVFGVAMAAMVIVVAIYRSNRSQLPLQSHVAVTNQAGVSNLELDETRKLVTALPPWWILHHVTPAGEPKSMGTYTAVTFSQEQQAEFGIDEQGTVKDKTKFDNALQELDKRRKEAENAPKADAEQSEVQK